jgi:hypothetical protein
MEVEIANMLGSPIHVAVVQHSPTNLEFVVSTVQVPIPTGKVLGHWDIEPGHALSMKNVDVEANMGMSLQGYPGGMRVTQIDGKKDDEPYRQIVLRPLDDADSGPSTDDPTPTSEAD